ncbi:hypothetical protein D9758_007503 [Tetrapyrgos nigripes]|uniref:Uncharacterized protein n=1 Tax=Tetrapyrgos nigripes TaxID=182062 RepID=A0A8H5LHT5_9AGAR|nr:hypothetical protein D9758_007503 [Tetrapyrgos nigripes]
MKWHLQNICIAVQEAQEARENSEINGGDDDADDDAPLEDRPSRREAMEAVSVLQRYTHEIDEPFARKLEVILASFGRQTRLEATHAMHDTQITQFFQRSK